jgi:predicted Zn finger-like uncharacterized protein
MFRVASDQLKLRGGIVRCGACQEIFDGSASLVDLDKLPVKGAAPAPANPAAAAATEAPAAPPPVPAPPVDTAPAPTAAADDGALPFTIVAGGDDTPADDAPENKPDVGDLPVYTLDFDHTFDPLGILPKVASPDGEADGARTDAAPDLGSPAGVAGGAAAAPAAEQQTVVAPVAHLPSTHAAMDADGEIDALALLQPWSRPASAGAAAQPTPAAAAPLDAPAADDQPAQAASTAPTPPAEDPSGVAALPEETQSAAAAAPGPAALPVHAAVPDSAGRIEPAFDLPVDEELVAAPLPGQESDTMADTMASAAPHMPRKQARADDAPPLLTRESAASVATSSAPVTPAPAPAARTPAARRAEKAAARRSKLIPTRIEPAPKLRAAEIDEPDFVKRSRQQEQSGRTRKIAMLAGSIVLLLVLLAQGAVTFRNALAARFPATKPVLVSSCALLGCRVELPAQVDKLTIETGELTTLGGGAYSFTTELRNNGDTVQAWPSLELALTDANERPLVRRVFRPNDYLAAGTVLANGMAPGTAQAIKLHFRVDDLKPSGYHIAVFYP